MIVKQKKGGNHLSVWPSTQESLWTAESRHGSWFDKRCWFKMFGDDDDDDDDDDDERNENVDENTRNFYCGQRWLPCPLSKHDKIVLAFYLF